MKEIPFVNLKKQVSIIQLTSDCIGLYGSEPKSDGESLLNLYFMHCTLENVTICIGSLN